MRARGRGYTGKTSPPDLSKGIAGEELATADSSRRHPEDSHFVEHAIREGSGTNGPGDRFPAARNRRDRQANVLLLRKRCFLLTAKTPARQPQHGPALRHGESHLRNADGPRRTTRRLHRARGFGCGQFARGVELEDWAGENARGGSGDL